MVARLRVSTSGTAAVSDDYANGAPTAGRILFSGGAGAAPTWADFAAGLSPIAQTLVVDAVNFSATPTGTFAAPFAAPQAAINYAVLQGWAAVTLLVAPGTYNAAVAIPENLAVVFVGYDPTMQNPPVLGGDVTITGGIGSSTPVGWVNCVVSAAEIQAANIATQDLSLNFWNCENSARVRCFNLVANYSHTTQFGNVANTGGCQVGWDGYSWARTLNAGAAFPAGATRSFWDAGHDIYQRALTINGLAIGTTGFVTMAVSTGAFVRTADHASVKVVDPAVQDFICGVHGVGPGTVTCWITNLSRVSTNFNEAIQLLIHHADMIAEPAP